MFEFELKQTIYYLGRNNKIHSAPVLSRQYIDNVHSWSVTTEQEHTFARFGIAGVMYSTCHGIIPASDAFESKQALADNLVA